ncbi:MAG TPA: kelch repeat-containing protein [Terriglobales bacterium]|jgi:Galactose oxidase, central domain|nr:kelch repeat-containing protein [Terriglobales bacterium]
MSHDRAGNVALFGGFDGTTGLADTWIWNGSTWMQQTPASSPAARNLHAMVFDPDVGGIVLFGGTGASATGPNHYNDTWLWDGSNWTQVSPPGGPPSNRYAFGMVYDNAVHAVVIYGGYSSGPALQDTWELSLAP